MRVVFLGNGSSGNATYFTDDTTSILIDNGLPLKRIPYEINGAILLTHSHIDHCEGVNRYIKKHKAKTGISCIVDKAFVCEHRVSSEYIQYQDFISGNEFMVGTINVKPIGLWHDEVCFAFMINKSYIHLTDTGKVPFTIARYIEENPIKLFYIESNYDEQLIDESDYDTFLKQRIKSRYGHLSNQHVIDYLNKHVDILQKVETIVLGHLSDNTNNKERLLELVNSNLNKTLLDKVTIGTEGTEIAF